MPKSSAVPRCWAAALALTFGAPSSGGAPDPAAGLDSVYRAELYEAGSNRSKLLFEYQIFESPDRQRRATRYLDPSGALAAREELVLEKSRLRSYEVDLPPAGRNGRIERVGDQLRLSYSADGRSETATEDYSDDVVVGLMVVPFIQAHWAELSAGQPMQVRLAVADRLQTFGFELALEESEADGQNTIRFAPSSFLFRLLVEPLFFSLTEDGATVLRILGRTTPLRRIDGAWKPVDVEGVYTRLQH